ncbi:MAG: hypothetical protein ABIT38_22350, partial [Gemmatimonadaceae bacterium]
MHQTIRSSALVIAFLLSSRSVVAQGGSNDFGALRLRSIGPANMSGRITDIAVNESNSYEFYAASATGGVWKTGDNGVTWNAVFDRENTHS